MRTRSSRDGRILSQILGRLLILILTGSLVTPFVGCSDRRDAPRDIMVSAPSLIIPSESFGLTVAVLNRRGFPLRDFTGEIRFSAEGKHARVRQLARFKKRHRGRRRIGDNAFDSPGPHRIEARSDGLRGLSNPVLVRKWDTPYRIYWGDLHVHTYISGHGKGTPEDAYVFARDVSGLHFATVTEHAYGILQKGWYHTEIKMAAEKYNDPGRFITFHAYESSHTAPNGGDMTVIYRDANPRVAHMKLRPLTDLWKFLDGADAITYAQHPARGKKYRDWELGFYGGPEREPVLEIYSEWGASEYRGNPRPMKKGESTHRSFFQDALALGYRVGVTGNSDTHVAAPGGYVHGSGRDHRGYPVGQTAVFAKDLTRDAIFDAIRARRCYATSQDRIILFFFIDGHWMGEEIRSRQPVVEIEVLGSDDFEISLLKNNEEILSRKSDEHYTKIRYVDKKLRGPSFYYVRVTQKNGERAWSSPIWVDPVSGDNEQPR